MRLLNLQLTAFGPFDGAGLDFSASASRPRVHVVYGLNEAGKSSALRGLRAALFGFPRQTGDNFRHPYPRLQVGATIQAADGSRITFIRRKRDKNSLLSADERTPLPDDALRPFLGSLREEDFFSMFAIGHGELRVGGQAVAQGQGRLGEILFMASAGLPRLRKTEQTLKEDAERLFLKGGKNPTINDALLRLAEIRKSEKAKYLRPDEFVSHTEALSEAESDRAKTEEELATLQIHLSRLDRLSRALPAASRLKQSRSQLDALGEAPRLLDDFAEHRVQLETGQQVVSSRAKQLEADLDHVEGELTGLSVPDDLIAASAEVERLFKRLGSYEQAVADMPQRLAEATQLEEEARSLLREVRPNLDLTAVEPLRLTRQEREAIRELAGQWRELRGQLKEIDSNLRRLQSELDAASTEAADIPPEGPRDSLRHALRRAAQDACLDAELAEAVSDVARLGRQLADGVSALSLWEGDAEDLVRLPVPTGSTIEQFEQEFVNLDSERDRLTHGQAEAERQLRATEDDLAHLGQGGGVPTEEALRTARHRRDEVWHEIRQELASEIRRRDADVLSDSFETAARAADEVADRLRREANRVERFVGLSASRDRLRDESERLTEMIADVETRRENLSTEWGACWPFLPKGPRTPREMREWLTRHAALVRLVEQFQTGRARAGALAARRDARRDELAAMLREAGADVPSEGVSLGAITECVESLLSELDRAAERRRSLRETADRAAAEIRRIERAAASDRGELAELRQSWGGCMARLGLAADTSPRQAETFLSAISELFSKLDKAAVLHGRIEQMRLHKERFAADARETARRLAPDIVDHPAEQIASQLNDRLTDALSRRDLRQDLSARRGSLRSQIEQAKARAKEIVAELAALCRQAGCDVPSELPAAEQRAAERRRLEAQITEAENELSQCSGGRAVVDLLAEIEACDTDAIKLEIDRVTTRIEELQNTRVRLAEIITSHKDRLASMAGGAEAVAAAEEAEAITAQLTSDIERYAKLRFAAKLLRDGRERFKQKSGNAVLDRAGKLFATLTCGRFVGLEEDYGENDEPLLVGVRQEGGTVRAEGMSDGTADQLYLALRLAGLSAWLDAHDPLPFLVDDILVHFDDARSAAALTALASLASRTQVILFTHHRHLVDLARDTLPADVLHVHELGDAKPQGAESRDEEDQAEPVTANGRSKRALF